MAEFPLDLISQILPLLPVSSLLRFKCVSKSFHRIIDSPNFINSHFNSNRTRRKLIFHNTPDLLPIHALDFDDPFQPLPNFLLKNPLPETDQHSSTIGGNNQVSEPYRRRFYSHCNGLVLTVEQYGAESLEPWFRVWNPSTRKYWKLPHQWGCWVKDCSLGYDPCTDDYKVLIVTQVDVCGMCGCCNDQQDEIWMAGLRSGCWKKIGDHNPIHWSVRDVFFVDGAFYFVLGGLGIYTIDVFEEKLSVVSLPKNDLSIETRNKISLQVLDGCLCVGFGRCRIRSYDEEEAEELYVREKNDNGEYFWTKLLSFEYFGSALQGRQLEHSKRRDKLFILHVDFRWKLYFYDFEEKSVKRIGDDDIKDCLEVIFCVESFASLDPYLVRKEADDESTFWIKFRNLLASRQWKKTG